MTGAKAEFRSRPVVFFSDLEGFESGDGEDDGSKNSIRTGSILSI
jgi:hypothetical protein